MATVKKTQGKKPSAKAKAVPATKTKGGRKNGLDDTAPITLTPAAKDAAFRGGRAERLEALRKCKTVSDAKAAGLLPVDLKFFKNQGVIKVG